MKTPGNVKEIVIQWLKVFGYDGLHNKYVGCGCDLHDLLECDSCPADCCPGYKIPDPDGEYNYLMTSKKP